jgi:hypothetical protein
MPTRNSTPIAYQAFRQRSCAPTVGPLSKCCEPVADVSTWTASCTVAEFLKLKTFPVWYVAPNGVEAEWCGATAHRIRFKDAVNNYFFAAKFCQAPSGAAVIDKVDAIVFECTTCSHIAVIDGNHRLGWLARNNQNATVSLYGLSGSRWSVNTPDMNVICACLSPNAQGCAKGATLTNASD